MVSLFHAIALITFIAPYAWFLTMQAAVAKFVPADASDKSVSLFMALGLYIRTGGRNWNTDSSVNWGFLLIFLLVLLYNVVRAILLWKTKTLEIKEHVSGLPARFYLAEPVGLPDQWRIWKWTIPMPKAMQKKIRFWYWLARVNAVGFWVMIVLVVINSSNFLMMRIPLAE